MSVTFCLDCCYIRNTLRSDCIIAIYHHFFSISTMSSLHCNRCWLLHFEVFHDSSPLRTTTTCKDGWLHWNLIFWVIKLSLHIMIGFLRAQWSHFTVTIVACYISKFLCHYYLQMSATTHLDFFLHWRNVLRHHIIAIYHHSPPPIKMTEFHCHSLWLLHFEVFMIPPRFYMQPLVDVAD